jgi:hypothetical protein
MLRTGNNRATARQRWLEEIVELKPLEYLLKVMNKNNASRKRRIAMARAALPYCHEELKPVPPPPNYESPVPAVIPEVTFDEYRNFLDGLFR